MTTSCSAATPSFPSSPASRKLEDVIREGIKQDADRLGSEKLARTADIMRFAEARYNYRLDEAIYTGIRAITKSTGPHDAFIWEAAAKWTQEGHFEGFLQNLESQKVVAYLNCFGYPVASLLGAVGRRFVGWGESSSSNQWPELKFAMNNGHEEHAGCTWYMVDCSLGPLPGEQEQQQRHGNFVLEDAGHLQHREDGRYLVWRAPRRLVHLREALHDFIKRSLDDQGYKDFFGETPFARHGGPVGTTARLGAWLEKLAMLINQKNASPEIVTRTIMFFRPPTYIQVSRGSSPDDMWRSQVASNELVDSGVDIVGELSEPCALKFAVGTSIGDTAEQADAARADSGHGQRDEDGDSVNEVREV